MASSVLPSTSHALSLSLSVTKFSVPNVRFHTTLSFTLPMAMPSAVRSSSEEISAPRIQSATALFKRSKPNSTCRGIKPPCAKTVSLTISTVLFIASCCARGPPGENRPTRALTCFFRGSSSPPPKASLNADPNRFTRCSPNLMDS